MKKPLNVIVAVGLLCSLVFIGLKRTPENSILSVTESKEPFEQIMVLKRDRTYEQLIKTTDIMTDKEIIIAHAGQWLPGRQNANSGLPDTRAGTSTKGYITYRKKLAPIGKGGILDEIDLIESLRDMSLPTGETLAKWKQWRAQAKPYDAALMSSLSRNSDPSSAYQPNLHWESGNILSRNDQ